MSGSLAAAPPAVTTPTVTNGTPGALPAASGPFAADGRAATGHAPTGHHRPSGWLPVSACTPGCLPPAAGRARLRVARRLPALVAVLLAGVLLTPLLPVGVRPRWLRRCCRGLLRAAGVTLWTRGDARFVTEGGALVVANHRSWLDVLALEAVQPVRMLAKREVRTWPLIGGLAARTGALFVDRAGLRALPDTVAELTAALRDGSCVGVFPEGTTWCAAASGPFRRAAFQAALDAGVPVRPVALAFHCPDGTTATAAAFVGDQSLLDSLLRVLAQPGLVCELTVLPLLSPHGDRRTLARRAADAVGTTTGVPHPDRTRPTRIGAGGPPWA